MIFQNLTASADDEKSNWLLRGVSPALVYPECAIPKWLNYRSKEEKISVDLPKDWYSCNFAGWAVCCITYRGDGVYGPDLGVSGNYDYTFIKTKLMCKEYSQELKVMERRYKVGTALCTYSSCLCIAYVPFRSMWRPETSETSEITNANQYGLFEESMDLGIANDWGVHLVYCKVKPSA